MERAETDERFAPPRRELAPPLKPHAMGAVAGPVNVLSQRPLQTEHTVEAVLVERGLHRFGELPST